MSAIPVIAIFDVGKTNKKLFLFDEDYHIVYEKTARFIETVDEDGDPCENLESLELSVFESLREVFKLKEFEIKAVNFSTYGASFVHLDDNLKPIAPLYSYLKEFPAKLKEDFYAEYGGEVKLALETSSPVLGNLNSGMQLYRIKHQKPELYKRIKYSLHLPQYLSFLLTGKTCTDITSIGCHTGLWDFEKNDYHDWVYKEGLNEKFAPILSASSILPGKLDDHEFITGVGLHDSSAALIPYLINFNDPFVLISTGTWCISLNPFNATPLTGEDLNNDCLCYMQYKGSPVKASRLFAGNEHEDQVKKIAAHFDVATPVFKNIEYDANVINKLTHDSKGASKKVSRHQSAFVARDLNSFHDHIEAYHQLMLDIMEQQCQSTQLILNAQQVRRIFVDGGFSKNSIYMNLLAKAFPQLEIFAASMAQATAVGTAIAIHDSWNTKALSTNLVELKHYSTPHPVSL